MEYNFCIKINPNSNNFTFKIKNGDWTIKKLKKFIIETFSDSFKNNKITFIYKGKNLNENNEKIKNYFSEEKNKIIFILVIIKEDSNKNINNNNNNINFNNFDSNNNNNNSTEKENKIKNILNSKKFQKIEKILLNNEIYKNNFSQNFPIFHSIISNRMKLFNSSKNFNFNFELEKFEKFPFRDYFQIVLFFKCLMFFIYFAFEVKGWYLPFFISFLVIYYWYNIYNNIYDFYQKKIDGIQLNEEEIKEIKNLDLKENFFNLNVDDNNNNNNENGLNEEIFKNIHNNDNLNKNEFDNDFEDFNNNNNINNNNINNINNNINNNNKINNNINNQVNNQINNQITIETPPYISQAIYVHPNTQYRQQMEDFHKFVILSFQNFRIAYFSIFDGHGGNQVSIFLRDFFHQYLLQELKTFSFSNDSELNKKNIITSINNSFEKIDKDIIENKNFKNQSGSTGTIILLYRDPNNPLQRVIICANVGDSKGYIINKNNINQITKDHNCKDENEVTRIKNNKGLVFQGRVFGSLLLTRSFGDKELKEYGVLSTPDIFSNLINDNDLYAIIGSDGVWDVISQEDLFELSKEKKSSKELCQKIVITSLERHSQDNISCFVVKLNE